MQPVAGKEPTIIGKSTCDGGVFLTRTTTIPTGER